MKKNYKNSGLKLNNEQFKLHSVNVLSVTEMLSVRGGDGVMPPFIK
jgi:hypothetical protein